MYLQNHIFLIQKSSSFLFIFFSHQGLPRSLCMRVQCGPDKFQFCIDLNDLMEICAMTWENSQQWAIATACRSCLKAINWKVQHQLQHSNFHKTKPCLCWFSSEDFDEVKCFVIFLYEPSIFIMIFMICDQQNIRQCQTNDVL